MPKKGLGRGLSNFFGGGGEPQVPDTDPLFGDVLPTHTPTLGEKGVGQMLAVADVMPNPGQPRKTFDKEALETLADSIAKYGVLQPITVRRRADGKYLIIAGERRWRAAQLAGLKDIPALVIEADDRLAAELALIENLQREDLNPIEEAEGYQSLIDDFGFTQEEIAEAVGRGRATIANSVRLLDLNPQVVELLRVGKLTAGHAKPLSSLDHDLQFKIAEDAARAQRSVREVEQMVKRIKVRQHIAEAPPKEQRKTEIAQVERYLESLGDTLSQRYERKVRITGAGRQGKVEFEYYNMDDLNRILELFLGMTNGGDLK